MPNEDEHPRSREAWETRLRSPIEAADREDRLDEFAQDALDSPPDEHWSPLLLAAARDAGSALTRRSLVLALGLHIGVTDVAAVQYLTRLYQTYRNDAFLGPAILDALGMAAIRSPLARSELTTALLTLQSHDDPHLLQRAAKVIGRITSIEPNAALAGHLEHFTHSSDARVQAEAHYQQGLHFLVAAFGAANRADLWEGIEFARDAFRRSVATDETRSDAAIVLAVTEALLAVRDIPFGNAQASHVRLHANQAQSHLLLLTERAWHTDLSPASGLLWLRVHATVEALASVAESVERADRWLRFDDAVVALATATQLVRVIPLGAPDAGMAVRALTATTHRVLLPFLGPVLRRVVGRQRLDLMLPSDEGEDSDVQGEIRALRDAVVRLEESADATPAPSSAGIQATAAKHGCSPAELMKAVEGELADGRAEGVLVRLGVFPHLPIDHPGLFGGDPAVDQTVRAILHQVRHRRPELSTTVWERLVRTLDLVISFVAFVRDTVPPYARSAADGGQGQNASEDSLRDELFKAVRLQIGRGAVKESGPLAGGRTDTGIFFPECMFPVECKVEHRTVDRAHIGSRYMAQADDYAAARDGISFLLILDLRDHHAATRPKRKNGNQGHLGASSPVSLYSLQESFWIDGLPPDPEVEGARPKVIVVGLVPGNRSLPSSKTTYSRPQKPC